MSKNLTIFNRIYAWLYQADGTKDRFPNRFFLAVDECLIDRKDKEFNVLLTKLTKERQDYFTSDREISALVLTHMLTTYKKDMFESAYMWFHSAKEYRYMYGAWFRRKYSHMHMYSPDFIVWYAKCIKKYGTDYFKDIEDDYDKKITLVLTYMAAHDCNEEDE